MTSTDECLSVSKKYNIAADCTSNDRYSNFNLNQSHNHSHHQPVEIVKTSASNTKIQAFLGASKPSKDYKFKDAKGCPSEYLNIHCNFNKDNKNIKAETSKHQKSSSTLSLHIAAYEDSLDRGDSLKSGESSGNSWKKLKHTVKDDLILPNPFEFPRQQNSKSKQAPEISNFSTSQRLLNPNGSTSAAPTPSRVSKHPPSAATTTSRNKNTVGTWQLRHESSLTDVTTAKLPSPETHAGGGSKKSVDAKRELTSAKEKPSKPGQKKTGKDAESTDLTVVAAAAIDNNGENVGAFDIKYENEFFILNADRTLWRPRSYPPSKILVAKIRKINQLITKGDYVDSGTFGSASICSIRGLRQKFIMKTLKNIGLQCQILKAELAVYSEINSDYLVKCLYAGIDADRCYSIVLEYATAGTLENNRRNIAPVAIPYIAAQIAKGLGRLHEKDLSHGDLKPNNVGLTCDGFVKLFDFGNSRRISTPIVLPKTATAFSAPENQKGEPAQAESDLWSLGCILVYLYQKDEYPFDIFKTIGIPVADSFIRAILKEDKSERLTKVFDHPYLQNLPKKPVYVPGEIEVPKRQRPVEEADKLNAFGFTAEAFKIMKEENLYRFPSIDLYKSFYDN